MKHLILICCVVMMMADGQTTMEDDDATCQLEIMEVINSRIDSIVDVITQNFNAKFDHLNKGIANINKRLDGTESALQPGSKECKPGWSLLGDSCYIIPEMKMLWDDAKVYCMETLDSHLAILDNLIELETVKSNFHGYTEVYVGARRHDDDLFYWERCTSDADGTEQCDYTPVKEELWAPGEPNNSGNRNENWVEIYWASHTDNRLNDETNKQNHFMCEYELT